jgi:hypothetical protein
MPGTISRRSAMGMMGAGSLAAAIVGGAGSEARSLPAPGALPVEVGTRFGRWTVSAIHPVADGALRIGVRGAEQHEFVLEVMARDPSPLAPRPPAATEALSIFVRNGGDGWLPTEEEQGLAAMTLAHLLSTSGRGGPIAGLLTHGERVALHHATLMGEEHALHRQA